MRAEARKVTDVWEMSGTSRESQEIEPEAKIGVKVERFGHFSWFWRHLMPLNPHQIVNVGLPSHFWANFLSPNPSSMTSRNRQIILPHIKITIQNDWCEWKQKSKKNPFRWCFSCWAVQNPSKSKKNPKRVCAVASTLYIHRTSVSCSIQCGVETAELKRDESYPRSYLP